MSETKGNIMQANEIEQNLLANYRKNKTINYSKAFSEHPEWKAALKAEDKVGHRRLYQRMLRKVKNLGKSGLEIQRFEKGYRRKVKVVTTDILAKEAPKKEVYQACKFCPNCGEPQMPYQAARQQNIEDGTARG